MKTPEISVVVGSQDAYQTIVECLTSLEKQIVNKPVEVIVADYSTDGTTKIIEERFPKIKLIKFTKPMLIPELWGAGISLCTGEIIAITTAHCIPDKDWISEIQKAHDSYYVAVGGAIECWDGASLVDWAIYFCRYTPFMKPFSEERVQEVPGDNGSYKRKALEGCKELWRSGFWETVINAKLRVDGMPLFCSPSIIVYHKKSFGMVAFIIQRFYHGIHFGTTRVADFPILKRIIYIVLSPLIPFIFFLHITRRVIKKKRHLKRFAMSAPILFLLLIGWATGELWGYLSLPYRK